MYKTQPSIQHSQNTTHSNKTQAIHNLHTISLSKSQLTWKSEFLYAKRPLVTLRLSCQRKYLI